MLLNKAVSNVIASLTFGRRFQYDDPRFLKLLGLTEQITKEGTGLLNQVGAAGTMEACTATSVGEASSPPWAS